MKEQLLEVGDEVLVLLPTKQNKLKLQWSGPYQITRKVTPVNYDERHSEEGDKTRCWSWEQFNLRPAPVILVEKKDGDVCFCVDHCKVNQVAKFDA